MKFSIEPGEQDVDAEPQRPAGMHEFKAKTLALVRLVATFKPARRTSASGRLGFAWHATSR